MFLILELKDEFHFPNVQPLLLQDPNFKTVLMPATVIRIVQSVPHLYWVFGQSWLPTLECFTRGIVARFQYFKTSEQLILIVDEKPNIDKILNLLLSHII